MKSTKLIHLLKSLSRSEMSKLEQFADAPFINTNEKISALLRCINKHYPLYESPKLEKEKVYEKLFPGEAYKDERMRYLISELLTIAEDFLVYTSYSASPADKQIRLLHELDKRGLDSLFDRRKKETEQLVQAQAIHSKSLLQRFGLAEVSMFHYQRLLMGHETELIKNLDYSEMIKTLTAFYLEYSLKMYCAMLAQGKAYNKENPFHALDETFETLQREIGAQPEITQLHSDMLLLLKTNDEQYYFKIKDKLFHADTKSMRPEDQRNFVVLITNFCVRKYKEEHDHFFFTEINALNKFSIERKLFLFDNKKMSHAQFTNIVVLSIDAGDAEWMDDFIEKYSPFLPDDVRESTTSFAKANLAYYKKDYRSALHYLRTAKYENPMRQTGIKNLLLKIYFDTNETELIVPLIDSYLHVIKGSAVLNEESKTLYLNFIRFFHALYRAKQNNDTTKINELHPQLLKEKYVAQRIWLLQKIGELTGSEKQDFRTQMR